MTSMLNPGALAEKGEEIYRRHREELESKYGGKIVVIDVKNEVVVSIGDTLKEADAQAEKEKRLRYVRRIGKNPAVFKML